MLSLNVHDSDHPDFEEHESGQPESEAPSTKSLLLSHKMMNNLRFGERWLNARILKSEMTLGGRFPKIKKSFLMGFTELTEVLSGGQSLKRRESSPKD